MELLEIHLLGGFRVVVDGQPLPDGAWRRRAADLVKVLALAAGHALHRERVADAIWSELDPEAGLANLHKAAHLARRTIGDPAAVVLRHGEVALAPGGRVETDVERFEATGDPELYTGELLPGDRYEPWAEEPRERLRQRYRDALRAAERWEELAGEDPADEEAQRALMDADAAAGHRQAALERFHRLRAALAEAGLTPSAETAALHDAIARGPAAVAPLAATRRIVGRRRELDAARAVWRRAGAGRGGALVVTGEAGIGKTRLCEELLAEASAAGWTTLRGGAQTEEGSPPYAPVAEALDRLLLERPDLAGQVTDAARAELARFSVAFPGAASTPGRPPDRQRIFAAIGQLLAAAAREHGTVLLVEDVHAADDATVQLLHALARAARFQRLLIVLSCREETAAPVLLQVRASLLEQRIGEEIRLAPLERDAALALAGLAATTQPGKTAEDAIWRLAGGNAFFTEELAAAIRPDGTLDVPLRLYEVLNARLSGLEEPTRSALARIGVRGSSFSPDELSALGGLSDEETLVVVDRALAAGVVRPDAPGYGFRHELVREALVRTLPPHRRAAAHRDVAELLKASDAPSGQVAHHLLEGDRAADAVPWLERAARSARDVAAYVEALDFTETALLHASEVERRDLLPLHADLLFATGDPAAAAAYGEAIAAGAPGPARLRASQARALLVAGDVAGATGILEGVTARSRADRARLAVTSGIVAWFRGDLEAAQRGSEEGLPLARAAGLVQETMEATQLRACLAHTQGDWGGRVQRDLVETLRRPESAAVVFDAHICIAEWVLTSGEPYDELTEVAGQMVAGAQRSGARRALAFATTVLGEAELLAGNVAAAAEHLQIAVDVSREIGTQAGESLARLRLAETALAGGADGEAAPLLDAAIALARDSTLPDHLLYLAFATATRAAAAPEDALALVDEAEVLLAARPRCPFCPIGFWVAAAIACAEAGSLERSNAYLSAAESTVPLWPGGPWPAAITEARAARALADEDHAEAARLLAEAAAGFARAGQPLAAARAQEAARRLIGECGAAGDGRDRA